VLEIRAAGAHDATRLLAARRRALTDEPEAFSSTVDDADAAWAARVTSDRDGVVLIALDAGAIVGTAGVRWFDERRQVAALWGMWIDPARRGTGAGRELIAAACAWVCDHGGRWLRLGVFAGDRGARGFYARLGFVTLTEFAWSRDPSRRVIRMVRPVAL
jgi:RimJ/RimL family protein N-acetyltransferase